MLSGGDVNWSRDARRDAMKIGATRDRENTAVWLSRGPGEVKSCSSLRRRVEQINYPELVSWGTSVDGGRCYHHSNKKYGGPWSRTGEIWYQSPVGGTCSSMLPNRVYEVPSTCAGGLPAPEELHLPPHGQLPITQSRFASHSW